MLKKIFMITLIVTMTLIGSACTTIQSAFTPSDAPPDDSWATSAGGIPEHPRNPTLLADAASTAPAAEPATQPTITVTIDNFTFSPKTLTISPGTTITWINHDDIPHTATSSDKIGAGGGKRIFNTGVLDTDQKASYTFNTPGTYPYFCTVHPHMTATIIVK